MTESRDWISNSDLQLLSSHGFKALFSKTLSSLNQEDHTNQQFLERIYFLIQDPNLAPTKKFYLLYLLFKLTELGNYKLAFHLAKHYNLMFYIQKTAETDLNLKIALDERGEKFFSKTPSESEARIGVNYVQLALECLILWKRKYGNPKKDPWKEFEIEDATLRAKVEHCRCRYHHFIDMDYEMPQDIAGWNFLSTLPKTVGLQDNTETNLNGEELGKLQHEDSLDYIDPQLMEEEPGLRAPTLRAYKQSTLVISKQATFGSRKNTQGFNTIDSEKPDQGPEGDSNTQVPKNTEEYPIEMPQKDGLAIKEKPARKMPFNSATGKPKLSFNKLFSEETIKQSQHSGPVSTENRKIVVAVAVAVEQAEVGRPRINSFKVMSELQQIESSIVNSKKRGSLFGNLPGMDSNPGSKDKRKSSEDDKNKKGYSRLWQEKLAQASNSPNSQKSKFCPQECTPSSSNEDSSVNSEIEEGKCEKGSENFSVAMKNELKMNNQQQSLEETRKERIARLSRQLLTPPIIDLSNHDSDKKQENNGGASGGASTKNPSQFLHITSKGYN